MNFNLLYTGFPNVCLHLIIVLFYGRRIETRINETMFFCWLGNARNSYERHLAQWKTMRVKNAHIYKLNKYRYCIIWVNLKVKHIHKSVLNSFSVSKYHVKDEPGKSESDECVNSRRRKQLFFFRLIRWARSSTCICRVFYLMLLHSVKRFRDLVPSLK